MSQRPPQADYGWTGPPSPAFSTRHLIAFSCYFVRENCPFLLFYLFFLFTFHHQHTLYHSRIIGRSQNMVSDKDTVTCHSKSCYNYFMDKSIVKVRMSPVSRYRTRAEWENACWRKISKSENLLKILVTAHERHNLVLRAAVMDRISSGKSYRRIADELWLSSQTVSSIKKAMGGKSYRSYRERSKTERKKRQYSRDTFRTEKKFRGRPVRTKYGIVYVP